MNYDNIKEFNLEKIGYQAGVTGIQINTYDDLSRIIGDTVVNCMVKIVRDIQHSDTIELSVKTPLNWWQHLKHDLAPKWFLAKYPVKYAINKQTFKYDIELVSLPKYEILKNLSAHSPFIRGVVRSKSEIETFCEPTKRTKKHNDDTDGKLPKRNSRIKTGFYKPD